MVAYSANLTHISYGSFVTNAKAELTYVSPQLAGFLCYDIHTLQGQNLDYFLPATQREKAIQKHQQDFLLPGEQINTSFLLKSDGCVIPVSIQSVQLSGGIESLRMHTVLPAVGVENGMLCGESEPSLFASLLQDSPNCVFFTRPDGSILFANNTACSVFGYTFDEFCQVGRQGIFFKEDNAHLQMMLDQREEKRSLNCNLTATKKNGEKIVTEVTSTLYHGADGQQYTTSILTVVKTTPAELELELLMHYTEESFVLINRELLIVRFNRQFSVLYRNYFGREVQKGKSILDYSPSENKDKLIELYQKVLAGETILTELKINTDEKEVIFLLKYKPAKDGGGQINGVFVSGVDITDRKEL